MRSRCILAHLRSVAAVLALVAGSAWAGPPHDGWLQVPGASAVQGGASDGVVRIATSTGTIDFVPGYGWTGYPRAPAPFIDVDGTVYVAREAALAFGVPYVTDVRLGVSGGTTRIVFDVTVPDGATWVAPRAFERTSGPSRPSTFTLAGAWGPSGVIADDAGVVVVARPAPDGTGWQVDVTTPTATVTGFPLRAPDRFVIDVTPDAPTDGLAGIVPATPTPAADEVAPGVVYRRLDDFGSAGPTVVHLLELDPDTVELRVVGRSGEGRPVTAWAEGGVAAINAGYFDPATFGAIGLRRIAGTLLSWPSRGRAAVGFGPEGTTVARAGSRVRVSIDGIVVVETAQRGETVVQWSDRPGERIGSPRQGVLVLDGDGTIVSNTIGPRVVPAGGAALAYAPDLRPLAVAVPGRRVTIDARLVPDGLERSPWAVEAGPLLVEDGKPAFEPDVEAFARGVRILDEPTQQAALGVRADGTVLLVVAERMVAEDLIDVFLELRAVTALRLDSGSSATLVANGTVLNRAFERSVESAIVAVPRNRLAGVGGPP